MGYTHTDPIRPEVVAHSPCPEVVGNWSRSPASVCDSVATHGVHEQITASKSKHKQTLLWLRWNPSN
jgi:hypothetical protein